MSIALEGILRISRNYPDIVNLRDHLINKTLLLNYLLEVPMAFRRDILEESRYISFSEDNPMLSMVVTGTSEMLFKFKLAKRLGLDFLEHRVIANAKRKLIEFLNRITEEGMDPFLIRRFGEVEFGRLCLLVEMPLGEAFEYFEMDDLDRALFIFQLLRFEKYGDFSVFEENWLGVDYLDKEVEIMANRAIGEIGSLFSGESVDFFPEFGDSSELVVSGDLLVGNRLLNFCSRCSEGNLRRQSIILKASCLLDEYRRIGRTFVYGMRDGRLVEFSG